MTNSMIPYSFVPGTKAKASEVNANFIAVANAIDANQASVVADLAGLNTSIQSSLALKANKTELVNEFAVEEENTDLNDYKTKGVYIFSSDYLPSNLPSVIANNANASGMLIVTGLEDTLIKQIWISDGYNPYIFVREYKENSWSTWSAMGQVVSDDYYGYIKFPNGLMLQWGTAFSLSTTYPLAYSTWAIPLVTKQGASSSATKVDQGFAQQALTGFTYHVGAGAFSSGNWYVIGK